MNILGKQNINLRILAKQSIRKFTYKFKNLRFKILVLFLLNILSFSKRSWNFYKFLKQHKKLYYRALKYKIV